MIVEMLKKSRAGARDIICSLTDRELDELSIDAESYYDDLSAIVGEQGQNCDAKIKQEKIDDILNIIEVEEITRKLEREGKL